METLQTQKAKIGDAVICLRDGIDNGRMRSYRIGQIVKITHWWGEEDKTFGAEEIGSWTLNKMDFALYNITQENYQIY